MNTNKEKNTTDTYELQVKDGAHWKSVCRHSNEEYLKLIGDRHWARYSKRRTRKLA